MYQYIEEHFDELARKFAEVGYLFESGNNYYYFAKPNENNQSIEYKIEKALRWLDILAFFTTFRKDLCRGARFSPYDILPQIDINLTLKEQLCEIQKRNSSGKNYQEMMDSLLKEMQKDGFIDLENEMDQTWKILDAWDYMEQMVLGVNIQDDEEETKKIINN